MALFERIREQLAAHPCEPLHLSERKQAAVAMLLHENGNGLEVLLIQRALNKHDVWSGHLALPGGRMESADPSPKHTAERETWEEIGVGLSSATYLGSLPDVVPMDRPIVVSCFIFGLAEKPAVKLRTAEVADAFWISPEILDDPDHHTPVLIERRGKSRTFPGIAIPGIKQPLWGITYKLLQCFRERTL